MAKRKASTTVAKYSAKRKRTASTKAKSRKSMPSASLMKQVKALIASKKKDAADVTRSDATLSSTKISCLTSSTDFATAASGTGLLDMTGDEALINSVRLRGAIRIQCGGTSDPANDYAATVRKIVVWFNKPLLVASAAGTLPPVTEVLTGSTVYSLPVPDASNGGRFKILSDRTIKMGAFGHEDTAGLTWIEAPTVKHWDYTVKVGKMCKFKAPSDAGSTAGGHYDSDVSAGQVNTGLLCQYTLVDTGSQTVNLAETTRVNYTG